MPKILVVGSSNTDMVVKSSRLPAPGETILGGKFLMNPGGKGANQAVAAAKLGGNVTLISKIGADIFGKEALAGFQSYGIDTQFVVATKDVPSGVALIMVDDGGENCISVALGANATLGKDDLNRAERAFQLADFMLIQLETPIESVEHAIVLANKYDTRVVLNPAPAQALSDQLLSRIEMITPNETEAGLLTGRKVESLDDVREAAAILRAKGVVTVIITMGAQGAYVQSDVLDTLVPSSKVNAVDTTAAGDTFNGALVVGLSEGKALEDAIAFANQAAAISVTRMGAQASCPTRAEIN